MWSIESDNCALLLVDGNFKCVNTSFQAMASAHPSCPVYCFYGEKWWIGCSGTQGASRVQLTHCPAVLFQYCYCSNAPRFNVVRSTQVRLGVMCSQYVLVNFSIVLTFSKIKNALLGG